MTIKSGKGCYFEILFEKIPRGYRRGGTCYHNGIYGIGYGKRGNIFAEAHRSRLFK